MSLESFYGGKQGLSSVIKKAFRYISENDPAYKNLTPEEKLKAQNNEEIMEECLCKSDYTTVWYGELCIINTVNKNNPANGCLFKRTLSRQGSTYPIEIYDANSEIIENADLRLSAEYIGQIVGPASGTPYIALTSLMGVDAAAAEEYGPYDETVYEEAVTQTKIHNQRLQDNPNTIDTFVHDAIEEDIFVPGTPATGLDDVRYNWFNVRKNSGEDIHSWMYLGFQIPYLVIDREYETVNYWTEPDRYNYHDGNHSGYESRKFYQKWHIDIPRGVRGNGLSTIRLTTYNKEYNKEPANVIYKDFGVIQHNTSTDIYSINTNAAQIDATFLKQKIQGAQPNATAVLDAPIYVCDFTIFNNTDENAAGQTVTIYLGIPKDVKNITLDSDGTITFYYQDFSSETASSKLQWIENITFDISSGTQTIIYNTLTGNTEYIEIESPVEDANPAEEGWYELAQGVYQLTTDESVQEGKSYYELVPIHNKQEFNLNIPNKASFNQNTGIFTIGTTGNQSYNLKDAANANQDFKFRYPVNATLRGDATGNDEDQSRQIAIQYNIADANNQIIEFLGDAINYIQDMVLINDDTKPYNGHLLVLFNDPVHRPHANDLDANNQWHGKTWYNNINNMGENLYWWDIGSPIGYYNANVIGENIYWTRNLYLPYNTTAQTYNPAQLGLYELVNGVYSVTTDTTPAAGKTYYTKNLSAYTYNGRTINLVTAVDNIITYLNETYPAGLGDETVGQGSDARIVHRQGMMLTCILQSQEELDLNRYKIDITYYFAFDYNTKEWQLIQSFTSSDISKNIDVKIDGFDYPVDLNLRTEGSTFKLYQPIGVTKAQTLKAPWIASGVYPLSNN